MKIVNQHKSREFLQCLYNDLCGIFKEYTTHNWKNGWQHEGNILSRSKTIQNESYYNNLFLLQCSLLSKINPIRESHKLSIKGPNDFEIEVQSFDSDRIRIDIDCKGIIDLSNYYYVTEKYWESQKNYIIDICKIIYNTYTMLKKSLSEIPNVNGVENPNFILSHYRENQINKLEI